MSATSSFDRLSRRAMTVLGVVAFALGVGALTVGAVVDALPSSFLFVGVAGMLAFLFGLWMVRRAYGGNVEATVVPDVEYPLATPAPGSDIDRMLYRLTRLREGTTEYKNRIQERLAEVAVAVVRQRDGCSREVAVGKLREGTWTEDSYAAAFFAGGAPPTDSFLDRLLSRNEKTAYERWVAATVDAIVERAGMGAAFADESAERTNADADADESGLLSQLGFRSGSQGAPPSPANYRGMDEYADAERVSETVRYNESIRTGLWNGVTAFALVAAGWGVLTFTPGLLLVSVVGIGFAAYARAASPPPLANLDVERHLSETLAQPGEGIEVTVTVHNTGDSYLGDLRLIDRVPETMRVVEGSPRIATALGSDATATFSYTTIAKRGTHEWPLLAIGRDFSGAFEREAIVDVEGDLQCAPSLGTTSEMPVRSQTSLYSGQVDTDTGGAGLEFFSVREYREGDPMKRIDWKRHARTGELATIDFRQERAAKVVLLFDARESAYVSPRPGATHAVDRNVDAAAEVFASLFDRGDLVGLAAFDTVPCWLGPSAGDAHAERARQIFTSHQALASVPPDLKDTEGHYVDPMTHVRRQLSPETQIMLFSPLCDDYTAEVARQLDSAGHSVTIVSPDPTADRTVGQRLARVERAMRVARLRERGIRIVDWGYGDRLGLELERAQQRWAV